MLRDASVFSSNIHIAVMKWVQQPHLGNQVLSQKVLFPSTEALRSQYHADFLPSRCLPSFQVRICNIFLTNIELHQYQCRGACVCVSTPHCCFFNIPSSFFGLSQLSPYFIQAKWLFNLVIALFIHCCVCCVIKRHKQSLSCDSADSFPAVTLWYEVNKFSIIRFEYLQQAVEINKELLKTPSVNSSLPWKDDIFKNVTYLKLAVNKQSYRM